MEEACCLHLQGQRTPIFQKWSWKHIPQKHGCPVNFDKGSQLLSWAGLWAANINTISGILNLLSYCIIFYSLHTVYSLQMWLRDGHLSSKTSLLNHFHPKKVTMFSHHNKNLNLIFVLKALLPSYFISYKVVSNPGYIKCLYESENVRVQSHMLLRTMNCHNKINNTCKSILNKYIKSKNNLKCTELFSTQSLWIS